MIIDSTLGAKVFQDVISFAASGNNTVVAGIVGKRIKVLQIMLTVAAADNLIFKSATTALSGTFTFPASGSMVLDYIQLPLNCLPDDSFIISASTAAVVGGTIWYIQS